MDKLRQIATRAGVSRNTVLRVLRGENKEVWPSAIRRAEEIREIAKELAYLPNGSARSMRRGRFNSIALLLSTDAGRSYLPNDLFNQIHDSLESRGLRLIVTKLADEKLVREDVVPSILREMSCDGLLINYTDRVPQRMVDLIGRFQIPSIWVNCRQDHDCVYYDDFGGAMTATQHLLKLGHREIAYLDFVASSGNERIHYSRADRYEGYAQAMLAAGQRPTPRDRFAGIAIPDRLIATRDLLRTTTGRPTAIVCYDAPERVLLAAAQAGLSVPRDLSVVTFGTQSHERLTAGETFIGQSITNVRVPSEKAGLRAVEMLLQKIETPDNRLPPCVVPLVLEPGETTAAAGDESSVLE
jgi:DNA-binding LacI/PurR family transcriptional regulator